MRQHRITINLQVFLVIAFMVISTPLFGQDFVPLLDNKTVTILSGEFESGSKDYNEATQVGLDKLAQFLKKNRDIIIEIVGHTDSHGSESVNRELSRARAEKVRDYLMVQHNIVEERLIIRGAADDEPIADNQTEVGRAKNRRIDIKVVKKITPPGTMTYLQREVLTKPVEENDFINAILNQSLFHKDRVLTRKKSHATILFSDSSTISLSPLSLMVLYTKREDFRKAENTNIELKTGGLRTKLQQLKGKFTVETPSCMINADSVEIQVGIDDAKNSALSVFDGKSEVSAQGETVEVPEGYGASVVFNEPPSPPEPLPPPPVLITPIDKELMITTSEKKTREVFFQWASGNLRAVFQIARDDSFQEVIFEERSTADSATTELSEGTYFWRVAFITPSGIEGYSAKSSVVITPFKVTEKLPLVLKPTTSHVIMTAASQFSFRGETAAKALISVNAESFSADSSGLFSTSVNLDEGLNRIDIRGEHPLYFPAKNDYFVMYYDLWKPSFYFTLSSGAQEYESGGYSNISSLRVGHTYMFGNALEAEVGAGLAEFYIVDFPKYWQHEKLSIPLYGELHYLLGTDARTFYLIGGVSLYVTFLNEAEENDSDMEVLLSPEFGLGYAFPAVYVPVRFELKYGLIPQEGLYNEENNAAYFFNCKVRL